MKTKEENFDFLSLKWGTLKEYDFSSNEKCQELIKEYSKIGWACGGRMMQEDTPRQKEIILELIDLGRFRKSQVYLDWDSKWVSKKKAKEYILNYGKNKK